MTETPLCAICRWQLEAETPQTSCPACAAVYHTDCWQENGGCAVYGCREVPATEKLRTIEMPVAFWGRENKPCPACGVEILAAAVRCRHCGATFKSARPETSQEFQQRGSVQQNLPATRKSVLWLLVFCFIPLTAPFGALATWRWRGRHQTELRALPSVFTALNRIGLFVGFGQCALMVLLTLVYVIVKGLKP